MSWVDLRTGYRCNNRCRFCDQGDARDRLGDAPFAELVAALAGLGAGREDGVWLAGGEVTLRPDLPRLVAAAREAGFGRVGLQTNGRVLAAAGAAAHLRRAGLTDAVVAVHGPAAEVHDALTREPGSFRQAVLGVRRLREAGVATRLATVVTRTVAEALPAVAELAVGLGVEGHRWIVARAAGAARAPAHEVVPRLELLADPLARALDRQVDARLEVETVGVPLCALGRHRALAADRADAPPVRRAFPAGFAEPPRVTVQGPPCAGCALARVCPGLDAAYAERWGWDEVRPVDAPAPGGPTDPAVIAVVAPCSLACGRCAAREAWAGAWPTEGVRGLKQRLVRAVGEGATGVVFAGASPWDHPGLPATVREAARLGLGRVEVWGPLHPLADADDATLDRLAGLTAVRAPVIDDATAGVPGACARADRAAARLAERVPGCRVERYHPAGAPPALRPFRAEGAAAVWADCQETVSKG